MPEDKRVDDLREDLQELRREMHAGFDQIESRIASSNEIVIERNRTSQRFSDTQMSYLSDTVEKKFKEVDCKIDEHDKDIKYIKTSLTQKFNELDKRLFKLFFIGNAVGIAVGSVTTMIVQAIIKSYV